MKKLYLALIVILPLVGCEKETNTVPGNVTSTSSTISKQVTNTTNAPVSVDTLADHSFIKVALVLDSINNDETELVFVKTANPAYNAMEDGKYFQGFGAESLASLTSDAVPAAINIMPYMPDQAIGLHVGAKNTGTFLFKISGERTIPHNLQVWIKDNLLRDSLNLRNGNYQFVIDKSDSTSFGSRRFQLVLRAAH
jgi:hypothetical protein